MNQKNISISTSLNKKEIRNQLDKIILQKATFFSFIKGKRFQGKIIDESFELITFDSPPIEIKGTIQDSKLTLLVKWDSMKSSIKGFIYALGYSAISAIFIWRLFENPKSIWLYIIGLFSLVIPYLIYKYFLLFHYSEPNPAYIIGYIRKTINGIIEKE